MRSGDPQDLWVRECQSRPDGGETVPSRRSTVLHHHYAFDNTGTRGACKSVLLGTPADELRNQLCLGRQLYERWRTPEARRLGAGAEHPPGRRPAVRGCPGEEELP